MTIDIITTSTRLVYQDRWMRVRADEIRRRDGSSGTYGVIEKSDFAVIVPVENGSTYLVEQYRYPVGARYWEFPQGSWEDTPSADSITLARGELLEETGLVAEEMFHAGHLFECYGHSTQGYNIYLARGLTQHRPQREQSEQDMICRHFPLEEVERMIRDGIIKDAATVAAFGLLRLHKLI